MTEATKIQQDVSRSFRHQNAAVSVNKLTIEISLGLALDPRELAAHG